MQAHSYAPRLDAHRRRRPGKLAIARRPIRLRPRLRSTTSVYQASGRSPGAPSERGCASAIRCTSRSSSSANCIVLLTYSTYFFFGAPARRVFPDHLITYFIATAGCLAPCHDAARSSGIWLRAAQHSSICIGSRCARPRSSRSQWRRTRCASRSTSSTPSPPRPSRATRPPFARSTRSCAGLTQSACRCLSGEPAEASRQAALGWLWPRCPTPHPRLRSRLGHPQGAVWRGPERAQSSGEVWPRAPRVATARVPR